jgi:hypothetical protein
MIVLVFASLALVRFSARSVPWLIPFGSRATFAGMPIQLRTGCIHIDGPSVEFGAVQGCDGFFRVGIVRHLDERKAPGLARLPIGHDPESFHGSMFLKYGPNVLFAGFRTEVPDKNIVHLVISLAPGGRVGRYDRPQVAWLGSCWPLNRVLQPRLGVESESGP